MNVRAIVFAILGLCASAPIGWNAVRTPGLEFVSQADLARVLGGEECFEEDWSNQCAGHSATCNGATPQCSLVGQNQVCNQGGQYGWVQGNTTYPLIFDNCDGFFDYEWFDLPCHQEQLCATGCHQVMAGWVCDGGVNPPVTRGADFHIMEFGLGGGCDECGG